jgi:hypothetical protein
VSEEDNICNRSTAISSEAFCTSFQFSEITHLIVLRRNKSYCAGNLHLQKLNIQASKVFKIAKNVLGRYVYP